MIWGMTLEPGKLYTEVMGEEVQLSMASLDSRKEVENLEGESTKNFSHILMKTIKSEYVLCTLVHGMMFQQNLDLKLMPREKVTFSVQGPSVVYLTGYTASYPDDDESLDMEEDLESNMEDESTSWEPFVPEDEIDLDNVKEEPEEIAVEDVEKLEADLIQPEEEEDYREEEQIVQEQQQESVIESSQNTREEEIIFSVPDLESTEMKTEMSPINLDDEPDDESESSDMALPLPQPLPPQQSQQLPHQSPHQSPHQLPHQSPHQLPQQIPKSAQPINVGVYDIQSTASRQVLPESSTSSSDFFYPETQQPPVGSVTPVTFQPPNSANDFQSPNMPGIISQVETFVPPQKTIIQQRQSQPQRHPHPVVQGVRGPIPGVVKNIQAVNIQRSHNMPIRQYGNNTNSPISKSKAVRPVNVQQVRRISNVQQSIPGTSKQDMPGPSSSGSTPKGSYHGYVDAGEPIIVQPKTLPVKANSFTRIRAVSTKEEKSSSTTVVYCDVCGKPFNDLAKHRAHKKYHEKAGRYKCQICEKSFSFKNGLQRHIRSHTGEKPFKCRVCGKAFSEASWTRNHEYMCRSAYKKS